MKILGIVTDSLTGLQVPGVPVSCHTYNMMLRKRTNSQGEFEFEVMGGCWKVTVGQQPYEVAQRWLKTEVTDKKLVINLDMAGLSEDPVTG